MQQHRLDEFPTELIAVILQFCDPITMVTMQCTCMRLRILTMQILLSGRESRVYRVVEGISIRGINNNRSEWMVNIIKFPNEILDLYLGFLMEQEELEEMKRLDLCCFENLSNFHLEKVVDFMNKFKIDELIMEFNDQNIRWINNNLNHLGHLTKLSTVFLDRGFVGNEQLVIPRIPLKALHHIFLKEQSSIDEFCSMEYIPTLEEVTVLVEFSDFSYAFLNLLDKCTNLRELEIRTFVSNNFTSQEYTLDINYELLKIMRNCKLEVLRLDAIYEKHLRINKLVDSIDGIFPNLKVYSSNIPTINSYNLIASIHPLKSICVSRLNKLNNLPNLPKCEDCFLNEIQCIPQLDCRKLVIINSNIMSTKNLFETLSTIPDLRELHLHRIAISHEIDESAHTLNLYKLNLEVLRVKKSLLEKGLILQIIHSSPNLKEIHLEEDKITADSFELFDLEKLYNCESQLRILRIDNCSLNYSSIVENLIENYTFPYLESILFESTYSISKNTFWSLLEKTKKVSNFRTSGVEFDNELIGKYVKLRENNLEGEMVFNGKRITLEYLKTLNFIEVTNFSLPDCIIDNDEMIQYLETLNKEKLIKIQINLGKSGPSIELFKKLQEFTALKQIYLVGKPETNIEGFESYILENFLISLPNICLVYLECGSFKREALEKAKSDIRSLGRSAPRMLIPMERGPYPFVIKEQRKGSSCLLC